MRRNTLLWILLLSCAHLSAQDPGDADRRQIIVKLRSALPPQNFIADFSTHSRAGGGVWIEKQLSKTQNISLLRYDTSTIGPDELLKELAAFPDVESAHFDYVLETRQGPNDPDVSEQWGVFAIGADKAWGLTTGGLTTQGDTIVVAILDSGFDVLHEDLRENVWKNHAETFGDRIDNDNNGYVDDFMGWNFITNSPMHMSDQHGHSVAGIIGARGNNQKGVAGINWNIKLMLLETRMVSDIIAAYEYIIDQRERYNTSSGKSGAFVVATNASFGVNRVFCEQQPAWGKIYERLGAAGILTAAGAANNAWDVDQVGDMPTTCPSEFLLTVLNTNANDERYYGSAFGRKSIDMGAPGQNSYTTKPFNSYGSFNGNSAAAPHLAGAIALLYAMPCGNIGREALRYPKETALKVRQALLSGVDLSAALSAITATGGRLNVFNSLNLLMEKCRDPKEVGAAVTVFPNPAQSSLFLDFVTPAGKASSLKIFNALGQPMLVRIYPPGRADEIQTEEIPVECWSPGSYFVQIKRGNEVVNRVVSVQ